MGQAGLVGTLIVMTTSKANSASGPMKVNRGLAEMLKGGVIMDVVNPEQAKIADVTLETWQRTLDVNMTGAFLSVKHAMPLLINSGRGYGGRDRLYELGQGVRPRRGRWSRGTWHPCG